MDEAKDELFAHMQRCEVPGVAEEDVREWMSDTRRHPADRFPQLTEAQLASLEVMGRRYARPAIPHGKDTTARNRPAWEDEIGPEEASEASDDEDLESTEATGDELQIA